ncbi:MAG: hypothetical protein JWO03_1840 [Bacteroidetes bacterium]|nr:hypothetical protein [Bacteroidota bacterium]
MSHFNPAFFKFFEQLAKNNNKEWFEKNRKTYETEVKEPFKKFVGIIQQGLKKDNPEFLMEPSKAIFRINRDIRFAKDKSPYKNHVGAFFSRSGTKDTRPGYYLHLGAKEIFLGGGMYDVDKERLEKIRQEIYYNNDPFKKILNEKGFKTLYGDVLGDRNKVLTPDYKEFAREQPVIANKQFYYMAKLKKEDVLNKDFDKTVLKYFKAAARFNDFMMQAISE